jgi:hypothetical protein
VKRRNPLNPPFHAPLLAAVFAAVLIAAQWPAPHGALGAYTEPRLALLRAAAIRSTAGTISIQLEATFSFADVVQLGMPLQILVQQGEVTARIDLNGNAFTSLAGAPEQPAPGFGLLSVTNRQLLFVLPPAFGAGLATIQLRSDYEDRTIFSNRVTVTL